MQMEQLQKDMIAAMKARDKVRKDAISSLVSAAKKAAIDEGCRDNIPEELVNKVILKEMKSVKSRLTHALPQEQICLMSTIPDMQSLRSTLLQ